jgi:hypothetical protein
VYTESATDSKVGSFFFPSFSAYFLFLYSTKTQTEVSSQQQLIAPFANLCGDLVPTQQKHNKSATVVIPEWNALSGLVSRWQDSNEKDYRELREVEICQHNVSTASLSLLFYSQPHLSDYRIPSNRVCGEGVTPLRRDQW